MRNLVSSAKYTAYTTPLRIATGKSSCMLFLYCSTESREPCWQVGLCLYNSRKKESSYIREFNFLCTGRAMSSASSRVNGLLPSLLAVLFLCIIPVLSNTYCKFTFLAFIYPITGWLPDLGPLSYIHVHVCNPCYLYRLVLDWN